MNKCWILNQEAFSCFLVHSPEQETGHVELSARATVSAKWSERRTTGEWCQGLPVDGCRNDLIIDACSLYWKTWWPVTFCQQGMPFSHIWKQFCCKVGEIFVNNLVDWHTVILNFLFLFNFVPQNTVIQPLLQNIWQVQW